MHINDLPDRILEDIFFTHVYVHRQSRWPILQTCQKWYKVACNHHILWRSIGFCRDEDELPPIRLRTETLNGLAQLINRVGDTTFDLFLGCPYERVKPNMLEIFQRSVPMDWLSRCRSLTVASTDWPQNFTYATKLGDLLHSYSYERLECLVIFHVRNDAWEYMLKQLTDRVEKTSPDLKCLVSRNILTSEKLAQSILGQPSVLARIRKFEYGDCGLTIPWEDFTNLEDLKFYATGPSNFVDIIAPRLTRLRLGGELAVDELPSKIFGQITHLTLKHFKLRDKENIRPIQLPSLVSLTLIWMVVKFNLHLIHAPKLEHFEYKIDPFVEASCIYPSFEDVIFQPRIIHLDVMSNEDSHDPFGEPLQIWKKCKELHLVTFFRLPEVGETLADALSSAEEQCWPMVESLTVLYRDDNFLTQEGKRSRVEDALHIHECRMSQGLMAFKRLEVGWYSAYGNDAVLDEFSREWWVTAWVDCLH